MDLGLNAVLYKLKTKKEFYFRYLISSLTSGSVELGSFFVLNSWFEINYVLAAIASFVFSALAGYVMKRKLAFRNTYRPRRKQFTVFLLISLGGIIINTGTVIVFVEAFVAWPTLAKLAGILVAFVYNYLMSKNITFKIMK
ncbi:MAG: GtrA family protein [archaeon]